jgi:hypothetical protein
MTQRGARRAFQDTLAAAGVEVVQFDFLTPEAVAAYCHERGFLQARAPVRRAHQRRLHSVAHAHTLSARLHEHACAMLLRLCWHAMPWPLHGLALVMMRLGLRRRAGRACWH